jgi:hypothetical protein
MSKYVCIYTYMNVYKIVIFHRKLGCNDESAAVPVYFSIYIHTHIYIHECVHGVSYYTCMSKYVCIYVNVCV